jgi:hypothetical protein
MKEFAHASELPYIEPPFSKLTTREAPYVYPISLDDELDLLFPENREFNLDNEREPQTPINKEESALHSRLSAIDIAWNQDFHMAEWLNNLPSAKARRATRIINWFKTESISAVSNLNPTRKAKFFTVLDLIATRNSNLPETKIGSSDLFNYAYADEFINKFLELPAEMCAILAEWNNANRYQVDFLRTSPDTVEWILRLKPKMLDALFQIFHEYWDESTMFVSELSSFTSCPDVLSRTEQWSSWAICRGCVPSSLAFKISVTGFDTEKDCQTFVELAHNAIISPEVAEEFETVFRLGDPMSEIQSWLRNQVVFNNYRAATRR